MKLKPRIGKAHYVHFSWLPRRLTMIYNPPVYHWLGYNYVIQDLMWWLPRRKKVIRQWVRAWVPCWKSNLDACRIFVRDHKKAYWALDRSKRHEILREIIAAQEDDRATYNMANGGGLW